MKLSNTTSCIYEQCSTRIRNAIKRSDLTLEEICESDKKILSAIQNNRITAKNPYLMCDRVLIHYDNDGTIDGIIPKLNFEDEQAVLWGTSEEIESYAAKLFHCIISDLLACKTELNFDIEDVLCDYVPYAKNLTYWNILFDGKNTFPALFFGIREDTVIENIGTDRENAIAFLYIKCKSDFIRAFSQFAFKISSFKKIDKVFSNDFVCKSFIPILKKHMPDESSLGLRVKNLILADLSHVPNLITATENKEKRDYYKQLINASSDYIIKLEKIQAEAIQKIKQM